MKKILGTFGLILCFCILQLLNINQAHAQTVQCGTKTTDNNDGKFIVELVGGNGQRTADCRFIKWGFDIVSGQAKNIEMDEYTLTFDNTLTGSVRLNVTEPTPFVSTFIIGGSATSTNSTCQSPYIEYLGKCVDPIPACRKPISNSTSCIDKIENGQYIDHYSFSCLPGYQKTADQCIGSTTTTTTNCQSPYVSYLGKCVDPIPACRKWPMYAVACIDKIENGQYIERYNFQCKEGYVRSGDYCVLKGNFQQTNVSSTPIPTAGYEDEVITNPEAYQNPFPDTNTTYLEGKAAAELYRRGVLGGFPDGEFKGTREVNRAEAAKFLLLAKLETVSDMTNSGKFPDVMEGQWYVKFVMKAAVLGIINGYPDGYFRPQNTVNTAEFLKMLSKTFGLAENLAYSYSDVNSSDWFSAYAGLGQKYNLFPNRSTKLEPGKNLTRDEVAVAIYQYLKNR